MKIEMLYMLFICLLFFAIGDFCGVITKAKLSSVFVALILFLICFITGIIPADIIKQANLTEIGTWASPFIIFHMGTMINLGELKREWRTVLLSVIAMVVAMVSIMLVSFIPALGWNAAIVSIPVVNGGIVATQIMTEAATGKGLALAAALGTIVYAVQKFVGTPPASFCGLKEAEVILKEYREKKSSFVQKKDEKVVEKSKVKVFYEKHEKYFTEFTCLAIAALFSFLAKWLEQMTGLNYSIYALILGATVGHFNLVPPKILAHAKSSGLLSMAVFASIIPSLAKITLQDLGALGIQTFLVFAATLTGTFLFIYVLPTWKLVGSKNLAIGISMAQLLGFPATFLIANEIATAAAKNEEEKEVVLKKIMPAYVVAGFASVTSVSIIIAGIFTSLLR